MTVRPIGATDDRLANRKESMTVWPIEHRKGKEIFPNTQHRAGRIPGRTTFKLKIMEFKTERETVNSEITTETGAAQYRLRVTRTDGKVTAVDASVRAKDGGGTRGNLCWRNGAYSVGWLPYAPGTPDTLMADFRAVVEALTGGGASSTAGGPETPEP